MSRRSWISLLKREGYDYYFDKFGYWNDVLWAEKDGLKFPIAIIETENGKTSIIKHTEIACSSRNLRILENNYTNEYSGIKIKWITPKKATLVELFYGVS